MRRHRSLALVALLLFPTLVCAGERKADAENNYEIELPNEWSFLQVVSSLREKGMVFLAQRVLADPEKTDAYDGQGGQASLTITPMPEGKTVAELAEDQDVQGFMLTRFATDSSKWPELEIEDWTDEERPTFVLTAKGEAKNLKGKDNPAIGVLLVTSAKNKLYKLRMYAWTTEFDDEALKQDLDAIQAEFWIPDTTPVEPEPQMPAEGPAEPAEPEVDPGDSEEAMMIENLAQGWRLKKPVGIKSYEWDRNGDYSDVAAWFADNRQVGSYQIMLYVLRRGRIVDGVAVPDANLKEWVSTVWYPPFAESHAVGKMSTFDWPRKTPTGSFITLPLWDEERVLAEEPSDRPDPEDVSVSDAFKRLRFVEEVKRARLGGEKVREAYRGVLYGNRERVGEERVLRFSWGTSKHCFELVVSITRDGLLRWEEPIRELLESIEMLD